MEAKLASAHNDAVKGGEIHPATTSLDHPPLARGRQRIRSTPGGQGMAAVSGPLGGAVPRKKDRTRAKKGSDIPLKSTGTHLSRRVEAWTGDWREERLTEGERLWIDRMRRAEDQHAAAKRLGISRWTYQLRETAKTPETAPMRITPFEWCRIMRRRVGRSQREVAENLNVTRIHVHNMEAGEANCDVLLWYWEQ